MVEKGSLPGLISMLASTNAHAMFSAIGALKCILAARKSVHNPFYLPSLSNHTKAYFSISQFSLSLSLSLSVCVCVFVCACMFSVLM